MEIFNKSSESLYESSEGIHKEKLTYKDVAKTEPVCLICEKNDGELEYRGKPVCKECITEIRESY